MVGGNRFLPRFARAAAYALERALEAGWLHRQAVGAVRVPSDDDVVWLARRVLRHLSFPASRVERFPGAFDFRIMLTIGLLFVIWNLVVAQSVFWLRALAVPVSIALVVAGVFVAAVPFSSSSGLRVAAAVTDETNWLRVRRLARTLFVIAGLAIQSIVALGG
jgi:hypothetical protein